MSKESKDTALITGAFSGTGDGAAKNARHHAQPVTTASRSPRSERQVNS